MFDFFSNFLYDFDFSFCLEYVRNNHHDIKGINKTLINFSEQIFDEESRCIMGHSTTWSSLHEGKERTDELLYSITEIKISDVDHLRRCSHWNAIV